MQFKLSLFALSSLAMLVTATPLMSRKNELPTCLGKILCCDLQSRVRHETRMLLASSGVDFNLATGLVGTNCTPGDTLVEDSDDTCNDNNRIACCAISLGSTAVGCTAMDD